ncbi:MAG: triose-phosphate isomerase [Gammaproteobacteria bacterium]|nr:triose-phosphate isomerase [Gammaproteobacteria bacterium]
MRRSFVAGNWKMNGTSDSVQTLLSGIKSGAGAIEGVDIAVCPAFVHIGLAAQALAGSNVAWGGQNLCDEAGPGAFTGEVSVGMLLDLGCRYVIVGHSERRTLYGESDELVAAKFVLAEQTGLTPILCVGELLEEREAGVTEEVIDRQLNAVFAQEGGLAALNNAVIAYEPVWAIGTGLTATPEQAQAVHAFIRERLADRNETMAAGIRILYGGSVKSSNAGEIFAQPDIDGGLIGGASLQADEFLKICEAGAV